MPVISYAAYTFAVLGTILAILGISLNPRSWMNRLFALGMLMNAVWALCMAILYQIDPASNHTVIIQIMRASANLLNPLAAGFILAISRSRGFYSPALQLAMWGSSLAMIIIDLSGGSFGRGLLATPWGNAFIIDPQRPSYYAAQALMLFHFAVSMVAVIKGIDRSVSKSYRRQLLVIAVLGPFLQTGMLAANFILPLILKRPFPSTGLFFWGAVQIVLFISILRINLLENEAEVILKGVQYSRSRPVVYIDSGLAVTGMNEPAHRLLDGYKQGGGGFTVRDIIRDEESLKQLAEAVGSGSSPSLTVTLSDGLSSITLLHETNVSCAENPAQESQAWPPSRDEKVASAVRKYDLSPREQDVLSLLLQGHSTEEISTQLFISNSTAKTHISNIHRKVGTTSRPALLARVLQSDK